MFSRRTFLAAVGAGLASGTPARARTDSRLRKLVASPIPLRVRAASNPGGKGHQWVKKRFLTEEAKAAGRVFIPARLSDNEHLDREQYTAALQNLPAFERRQLLDGDWTEFVGSHFKPAQWPIYRENESDHTYILGPRRVIPADHLWTFATVDPATKGAGGDFTVIMVCGVSPTGELLVLHVHRQQMDVGQVIPTLARVAQEHGPLQFVGVESVAFSKLLVRDARQHPGMPPVRELKPKGQGKLERALAAIVKAEAAQIYLPSDAPWLDDFITELTSFTGEKDPCDDQVDALAYAVLASQLRPRGKTTLPILLAPGYEAPYSSPTPRPESTKRFIDTGFFPVGLSERGPIFPGMQPPSRWLPGQ
jgi:predicted phage terminase large subunit-like protein